MSSADSQEPADDRVIIGSAKKLATLSTLAAVLGMGTFVGAPLALPVYLAVPLMLGGATAFFNAAFTNMVALFGIDAGTKEQWVKAAASVSRVARSMDMKGPELILVDVGRRSNAMAQHFFTRRVFVTTRLIDRLSDDKLDGVVAHEMAHIHNHDTAGAVGRYLVLVGGVAALRTVGVVSNVLAGIPGLVVPNLALWTILQKASRWRERKADLYVAGQTEFGPGLASALNQMDPQPDRGFLRGVFRAHPYTPDRIAYINEAVKLRQESLEAAAAPAPAVWLGGRAQDAPMRFSRQISD